MWFLDISPVSPLFGYYLSISLGKFHGQWNDAEIDISVCAWKRGSQMPRVRVQHTHSKAQRLLHFHPSIGKLITERNVLYNFNFGMVKIAEASDLMVEVKVKGATLSRGGLVSSCCASRCPQLLIGSDTRDRPIPPRARF
jgi:hypothetical protein